MISRLMLTNFKAFRSVSIPLGPYTLLSGLNSSGKSSVMQSLALLRQSRGALDDESNGGLLLNGELVQLGTAKDVLHENYTGEQVIAIAVESGGATSTWTASCAELGSDLLPLLPGSPRATEIPEILRGTGFQYLHAERMSPAVIYPRSHEVTVQRGFLGIHGEHTVNYLRHFQEDARLVSEALHHPQARSRGLADETEAWLQEICPGVNLETSEISGTDLVRLSYRFGTAGLSSSEPYRPTNVGFGLTYVLPVIVACLIAKPGSLLLLENPEAHLHPRGQTAMARLTCAATAAGGQVIIESHSDHVLNGVRLAVKRQLLEPGAVVLHYFERDQHASASRITSPEIGADGMITDWPDGFFDEWSNSLDELLDP
jgi:predicted ATPase